MQGKARKAPQTYATSSKERGTAENDLYVERTIVSIKGGEKLQKSIIYVNLKNSFALFVSASFF